MSWATMEDAFLVTEGLAVDKLLRILFIDLRADKISPKRRRATLLQGEATDIVGEVSSKEDGKGITPIQD